MNLELESPFSVSTDSSECIATAKALADSLSLSFSALDTQHIQLVLTQHHLEIRAPELGKPILIDFEEGKNATADNLAAVEVNHLPKRLA